MPKGDNASNSDKELLMSNERKFKRQDGSASVRFISPKKLADEGISGIILEGVYEGMIPNNLDPKKMDFKFRDEDGNAVIINHTGTLAKRLSTVEVGDAVQVEYKGQSTITSGAFKGKKAHQFEVLIEDK